MISLNIPQGAVVGGNYAPPSGGGDGGRGQLWGQLVGSLFT